MKGCRMTTGAWAVALLAALAQPAQGDGGKVRVSRRSGPYLVTVFTTPTPLRAGRADVSVMVQDAETGEIASDVDVTVHLTALDGGHLPASYPATRRQATNKLLEAAAVYLPSPGSWRVAVNVRGAPGCSHVQFPADVLAAPPRWIDLLPWIAWPLLPIGLFALREMVVYANASDARRRRHIAR